MAGVCFLDTGLFNTRRKAMKNMNVLITFPVTDEKRKAIESIAPDAEYTYLAGHFVGDEKTKLTEEHLEKTDVILGCVPPAMLQHCRRLKFLQLDSAGRCGLGLCYRCLWPGYFRVHAGRNAHAAEKDAAVHG